MGLRILKGIEGEDSMGRAVLYCSTSGTALPWMFATGDDAERFVKKNGDVRRLTHLEQERLFDQFYGFVKPSAQEYGVDKVSAYPGGRL